MFIRYKYASKYDLEDILNLESNFYLDRNAPQETREGLELFLELGGKILIQKEDNKVSGCIESIKMRNLDKRILNLPVCSPLRKVYELHPQQYTTNEETILIHGWIANGGSSKWIYKEFFKRNMNEMIGFVFIENEKALYLYLKLGGRIIDKLPKIYSHNDAHYVIRRSDKL